MFSLVTADPWIPKVPDERLTKCAIVEGLYDLPYDFWSYDVQKWLKGLMQSTADAVYSFEH